jgi:hypothetical protein
MEKPDLSISDLIKGHTIRASLASLVAILENSNNEENSEEH